MNSNNNSNHSNIVIIKKNNFNEPNISDENISDENIFNEENINQNSEQENQLLNIKMQTKIFSVLLIAFSILLFIALISHTSKDEPNTQFRFKELFGLFSGEPNIKIKFDTTVNLLGLFGAYISDLFINGTIGFAIIGFPIFIFIWGFQLFKRGEISDKIVKTTNKYLIFSFVFACILGSLSNFSSLQNIPIEFYGAIGAFIGAMVSKTISPIGSTILFSILFIFLVLKFTNIRKNIRKNGFLNTVKNYFEKIKIDNIVEKINLSLAKTDNEKKYQTITVPPKTPTVTNSFNDFSNDNSHRHCGLVPQSPSETVEMCQGIACQARNDGRTLRNESGTVPNDSENISQKTTAPNIFYENQNEKNETSNKQILHQFKQNQNSEIIDDDTFNKDFKGKIKLKILNDSFDNDSHRHCGLAPQFTENEIAGQARNDGETVRNDSENLTVENVLNVPTASENQTVASEPTVIDEAVFTFQPPENLELPPQKIYVTDENSLKDYLVNPPIKLDFAKIDKEKEEQERKKKLLIEVDKTEEDIRKINMQKEENFNSGLRNPLSVGMHDEKIKYKVPPLDLLDVGEGEVYAADDELQQKGRILQEKLLTFGIQIFDLEVTRGPVVTQYEFVPADGVKISKIEGLADDLSMALRAKSVHIIAPVPGKGTVGIQIPNSNPSTVRFRSVISARHFAQSQFELPLALGKTVSGEPFVADLARMPHLLIAGSTGSGKSVGINTIISSLLYKKHPSQLKFVVIDPKKVELTQYARLSNHFLAVSPDLSTEIVTEPQDAITILKAAVLEMEKRYTLLEVAKQRNIKDYNEKVREGGFKNDGGFDHRELPYIVVIVDELADLMLTAGKEVELPIVRLAQMARAVGIHLIIATQRPSVNVITGIIKANFPARIAYLTAQKVDSRTILDSSGAEALLGNGDMLYSAANQSKLRIQNPFISTDEVEKICDFIGNQEGYSAPYMLPSTFESGNKGDFEISDLDPLFKDAAELVIMQQLASTSMLQRNFKIGFARAGRLMDQLAGSGVVGPQQGSKPRTVLMDSVSDLSRILG